MLHFKVFPNSKDSAQNSQASLLFQLPYGIKTENFAAMAGADTAAIGRTQSHNKAETDAGTPGPTAMD